MFNVEATLKAFTVVAFPVHKLALDVDTSKSPPFNKMSPSTSKLLLIFVVPDAEPISIDVAAKPRVIVVALAGNILNNA